MSFGLDKTLRFRRKTEEFLALGKWNYIVAGTVEHQDRTFYLSNFILACKTVF